jgi:hypothetical protein
MLTSAEYSVEVSVAPDAAAAAAAATKRVTFTLAEVTALLSKLEVNVFHPKQIIACNTTPAAFSLSEVRPRSGGARGAHAGEVRHFDCGDEPAAAARSGASDVARRWAG